MAGQGLRRWTLLAFHLPTALLPRPWANRRRPNRGVLADFLDVNIAVTGILPQPVEGLLGPSYTKALRASASLVRASAAALPTFSAGIVGGV